MPQHSCDDRRPEEITEVLSEQQCLELLASRDLGRLAFSIGDQPEIFPVNYGTDSIVVFDNGPPLPPSR